MKILILINSANVDMINICDCKTRNDFFVFMLKNYFSKMKQVEVFIKKCYPYNKVKNSFSNLYINLFPKIDVIIFVDELGFYDKDSSFLKSLKQYSKKIICSICTNSKFYNGEDIMFGFFFDSINEKFFYIKPPLDDNIYKPNKFTDKIYILLSKSKYNDLEINFIFDKINKNRGSIEIKIAFINTTSIDFVDFEKKVILARHFDSYMEYIYELSKANLYILTNFCEDLFCLYELIMCNTFIMSDKKFLHEKIKLELNVVDSKNDLFWIDFLKMESPNNNRNFFINENYDWVNFTEILFAKINELKNNIQLLDKEKSINYKKNTILNVENKINQMINKNYLKNNMRKKYVTKGFLLQSQLK